jgi:hypothetical protein
MQEYAQENSCSPSAIKLILRQGWFHSIQNIGHGDLRILVIFNNASPQDIGLSFGLGAMQAEVVAKVLGVSEETIREFNTRVDLIAPQWVCRTVEWRPPDSHLPTG